MTRQPDTFASVRAAIDADLLEYREERAAIGEYERGMSRTSAEAAADELATVRARVLARRHLP